MFWQGLFQNPFSWCEEIPEPNVEQKGGDRERIEEPGKSEHTGKCCFQMAPKKFAYIVMSNLCTVLQIVKNGVVWLEPEETKYKITLRFRWKNQNKLQGEEKIKIKEQTVIAIAKKMQCNVFTNLFSIAIFLI